MNTIVFHPEKDKNAIAEAAAILRRGGLLGIPTETVSEPMPSTKRRCCIFLRQRAALRTTL